MMKKFLLCLLCLLVLTSSAACAVKEQGNEQKQANIEPKMNYSEKLKAVWLSYYEIGDIFLNLDESAAKEKCASLFADLAKRGVNTVFFHARALCDAFYHSQLFLVPYYCSEKYDLLKIAVYYAHKNDISLHAWLNPYRVALHAEPDRLPRTSPALKLYQKNSQALLFTGDSIFLNPASTAVQALILRGIREIIENYDVDGIHFDDYFYPSPEKGIDKKSYAAYKTAGGMLSREQYRTESVNTLICSAYALIKQVNKNILFGVSPQCFIDKNKTELFADVKAWLERGSVDYLMPQIYFGFENESAPFEECVNTWVEFMKPYKAKLYVGLALYKSGEPDSYASEDSESEDSPYYEWVMRDDIIASQIRFLQSKGISGYSLYSYSSLIYTGENKNLIQENKNLAPLLQ